MNMSFTFTEQEWNYIFNTLSTRPYNEVFNLIKSLQDQFNSIKTPEPVSE